MPPSETFVREKQPAGHDGVKFSVKKMVELVNKDRIHPDVVAFARRAVRDGGYKKDAIGVARSIWDATRKKNIRWVPDPLRAEWLASARHFVSSEGKDDAYLVAGDCDELSILKATLFLAAMQASNVENVAFVLHSYAGRSFTHVLNAVHDGSTWVRVDLSGDWEFGDFKRPTYEALISLPSGRVLCTGASCEHTPPVASLSAQPWDHGRLEGLGDVPSIERVSYGTLGEVSDDDPAILEAFASILQDQRWSLAEACEDYTKARESLAQTFERLQTTPEERAELWPAERDERGQALLDAALLSEQAMSEVQTGQRRWAIDEETGDYAIERTPDETTVITSDGGLVNVLQGKPDALPPVLSGGAAAALPLPPIAIILLGGGGILLTLGGFWAILTGLHELADLARTAEVRAANDAVRKCMDESNDPAKCAELARAIAQVRSSREGEEAKKAESEAKKASSTTTAVVVLASLAALGAAAGAAVYLGVPQQIKAALARRQATAAA